jgi:hypothetical protein
LRTRDAVASETPARAATSASVGLAEGGEGVAFFKGTAFCKGTAFDDSTVLLGAAFFDRAELLDDTVSACEGNCDLHDEA